MRATAILVLAACLLLPTAMGQRRRQLNDENFEHITQAATGQTTGSWFVNFCSTTAKACKELAPAWEELGKELLQANPPVFLSTVDVHSSPQMRERFDISTLPTLLLFRDRKMYRFEGKLLSGTTDYKEVLRAFAQEQYAAGAALEVPPVPSPFDWLAKAAKQKLATVKAALEEGDLRALAVALLPVLLVCLLAMMLLFANLGTNKTKRE